MRNRQRETPGRDSDYITTGTEYYIAGRATLFANFMSCALQFHYGFELIMKGRLLQNPIWDTTNLELRFNHELIELWDAYIVETSARPSEDIGLAINNLHKWYEVRYPVFMDNKPNAYQLGRNPENLQLKIDGKQNLYQLDLESMDKIYHFLSITCPFNIDFVLRSIRGREMFYEDNTCWAVTK